MYDRQMHAFQITSGLFVFPLKTIKKINYAFDSYVIAFGAAEFILKSVLQRKNKIILKLYYKDASIYNTVSILFLKTYTLSNYLS